MAGATGTRALGGGPPQVGCGDRVKTPGVPVARGAVCIWCGSIHRAWMSECVSIHRHLG